jgi:hypothetical protein
MLVFTVGPTTFRATSPVVPGVLLGLCAILAVAAEVNLPGGMVLWQ